MNTIEFKSAKVKLIFDLFEAQIMPFITAFYENNRKQHATLIELIESRYHKLHDSLESAKNISEKVELQRAYKKWLLELIMKQHHSLNDLSITNFYDQYNQLLENVLSEIKYRVNLKEKFDGYPLKFTDNPFVTIRKMPPNAKRAILIRLKRIANFFRRIFRKKPIKVVVFRKRSVLFRNMAMQYFMNTLMSNSQHLFDKLKASHSKGFLSLWELDEQLNIQFQQILSQKKTDINHQNNGLLVPEEVFIKAKETYQNEIDDISEELQTIILDIFNQFNKAFTKADTLDLSNKTFGNYTIEKQKNKVKQRYGKLQNNWENTHKALYDDWAVDVEVTLLYYSIFDKFNYMNSKIDSYINSRIIKHFKEIRTYFTNSQKELKNSASSAVVLKEKLNTERKNIDNLLIDKMLTQTIEQLTGCFTSDFSTLQIDINELVEQVSEYRGFIQNKNYLKGVTTGEVKYISPRELLYFEALPVFRERVEEIEQWTDAQLETVRINLMGLGTICDFTLESAQIMLEENNTPPKKVMETAIDGFTRALSHMEKANATVSSIQQTIVKDLSDAINRFDDNILKLKNTDNIFELNLKIARIKAIEKTKQYHQKIIAIARKAIPETIIFFRKIRNNTLRIINTLKARLGISVEKKFLSFELSEFIEQTQHTLQKLPFVYQRLFQLHPIDEERFFVNRNKELGLLKESLENWKMDRFITIAIVGEKGSGITSLINFFLKKSNIDLQLFKHTLSHKVYIKELYFDLFSNLFKTGSFQSNDEIINYLNNTEGSRIVVLENLQHLFIKQVNGFDCMNLFFELIAHTMKKVLWIGAYTTHSWKYLDSTIHISNYFTTEIYIHPLNQGNIEEIIFKRNRLSGYQINFQPDTDSIKNINFIKLTELQKQDFLKHKYFSTLKHLSSGNISLALLYWLRSTQMDSNESISILPINEFDFSFVQNLSGDELFTLQTLILHDGLELEYFAKVMSMPIGASRNVLTPMLEKGLLIKPRLKYNINPIIFRPIANYLASRNFVN